jgi:hypothetical protein
MPFQPTRIRVGSDKLRRAAVSAPAVMNRPGNWSADPAARSASAALRCRPSGAALVRFLKREQHEVVNLPGIPLAGPADIDDFAGDDLDNRIIALDELKGFAHRLKGGVHGLNGRGIEDGILEIWHQGHFLSTLSHWFAQTRSFEEPSASTAADWEVHIAASGSARQ